MRVFMLLAVLVLLAAANAPVKAVPDELDTSDQDDALLLAYKEGREVVPPEFHAIHENPMAGQGARYRALDGKVRTYRVATVRGDVCVVERQLPASAVVIAVEFEVTGKIQNLVRRAWVGRKGTKPILAKVGPVTRGGGGGVGLNGTWDVTHEPFVDLEQGGRKWSGSLQTTKWWKRKANGDPDEVTKYWTSTENWFSQLIRAEVESKGGAKQVAELFECSDAMEPLLDWSGIPAPTAEEDLQIRAQLVRGAAQADLELMVKARLSFGNRWGLHPDAKVGDWARYSNLTLTLVRLEQGRAVVEASYVGDELGLVEAMEFEVKSGKAIEVVARFAGIRGGQPRPAIFRSWMDARPLETVTADWAEVELAGRKWKAREVRHVRKSLEAKPNATDEIFELLESEAAPFGQPLRKKSYWADRPESASPSELSEVGTGATEALDWSAWRPTPAWELPFTADDVKKFIKVGMKWRCKQELDKGEDGIAGCYQDWEVKEVTDSGYRVEVVLTQPDGSTRPLEATYTWDDYVVRFRDWPKGTIEKKLWKLGERELEVVFYRFHTFGKDVLFGLCAELPGVRICTEELLNWPSKTWLVDFRAPEAAKD